MKHTEILVYEADIFFTQKLTVIQMGVSGSDGSCTKLIQIYVKDVHEAYVFRYLCMYVSTKTNRKSFNLKMSWIGQSVVIEFGQIHEQNYIILI